MEAVLLAIHLIVAIAMVGAILLQRSEGGALGIGGNQGGAMMTARSAGDFLTRTTKWLAIIFLANSLALGWIASNREGEEAGAIEAAIEQQEEEGGTQLPELPSVPD